MFHTLPFVKHSVNILLLCEGGFLSRGQRNSKIEFSYWSREDLLDPSREFADVATLSTPKYVDVEVAGELTQNSLTSGR